MRMKLSFTELCHEQHTYTPEQRMFTPSLTVTTVRLQYYAQCLSLFLTYTQHILQLVLFSCRKALRHLELSDK